MADQADRLRMARIRARYERPADAAAENRWNYNTYWSNENGNAPFSFKMAQKYARKFGVRAEWLYAGEGPMVEPPAPPSPEEIAVPLRSWVSAGRAIRLGEENQEQPESFTILKGLPRSQYFATIVEGDSMDRISPHGSLVIVDTADLSPIAGKAYIFSINGEATYKIYRDRPIVRLDPFSTNPENEPIFPDPADGAVTVVGRVVRSCYDLR